MSGFIVASVAVAAYTSSLPGTFQYDDVPTIVKNEAVTDPGNLIRFFHDPDLFHSVPGNRMYRPVLLSTYLADYLIGGFRPFVWHLTNVLLHALNAALVFVLAGRLLTVFPVRRSAGLIPLLAGLAFALHPVHTEVVNYISSRSGAVATAGVLGSLILHLLWTRGGARGVRRAALLLGSALLFLLGAGGKEIAVAAVPAVFLLEMLDPEGGRFLPRLGRAVVRTLPLLVAAIGYMAVRKLVMGQAMPAVAARFLAVEGRVDPLHGGGRTVAQNLLTQSRVFWMYVTLMLFPADLSVDRFVHVSSTLTEPAVLAAMAGLALLAGGLWAARRRAPLVTFAGTFFILALLPTSSLIPLNVIMNEHRLYLPGVGFALLTGLVVDRVIARRRTAGIALAFVIAAAYLAVVIPRNLTWQDSKALWADAIETSPESFRAHNELGVAWHAEAQRIGSKPEALPLLEKAIAQFEAAERIYPDWYHAHLNLGIALRERGRITGSDEDFAAAVAHFTKAMAVARGPWRARYQIATTFGAWRKYDEAIRRFTEMAEEDREGPDSPRLQLYLHPLARLEKERGRLDEAEKLYREIVESYPDDLPAWANLASVLANEGKRAEADRIFEDLYRSRPKDPEVPLMQAEFFLTLDPPDRAGAAASFRKALALGYRPGPADFDRYLGGQRTR